ncbi:MAG: hypothetical protein NT139_02950 [Candidatus Woesearchaeota archaeon]|nr:hypothetical protein [Candidatus Woesearchaeota archaeon]
MYKKGDLDLSLKAIIGIVFGIIFLLIIFPLIENVYNMLASNEKDDAASFTEFVNRINILKDNEKSDLNVYVAENHCFIPFSKNQQEYDNIKRSSNCNIDKSCMCRCIKSNEKENMVCEECIALDLDSIEFEQPFRGLPLCNQELTLTLERKGNSITMIPKTK